MNRLLLIAVLCCATAAHAFPFGRSRFLGSGTDAATATTAATPTRTATVTPTPANTSTRTNTRTVTNTPTSTSTITKTPTVTLTPTVTDTATPSGDSEQAQIFLSGISNTDTTTIYGGSTNLDSGQTNEDKVSMPAPIAMRARTMFVNCTTAPGSGKTLTIQARKNGSNITGATCAMANTTTCNVTLTNDSTADFAAADRLSFTMIQSTTSSTASECRVTFYARASGDASELDSISNGGGGAYNAGAATVDFCGPKNATTAGSAHWACNNTTGNQGRWIFTGGTLSGLAMRTDDWNSGGTAAGAFLLMVDDGASSTDLSGSLVGGALNFSDTTCTSNCALDPAELVRLRDTQGAGNSSASNFRRYAWSINGVGAQFSGSIDDTAASGGRWSGPTRGSSVSAAVVAAPISVSATARNLQVKCVTVANATTFTLQCGATIGAIADTTLTCTTGTGAGASCSDTTHAVTLNAGDVCAWHHTAATAGTGGAYCDMVAALGPGTAATPTATATPVDTATPVNTATSTSTATATPTAVATAFDSTCSSGDCATVERLDLGGVYPPTGAILVTSNTITAQRTLNGIVDVAIGGVCWTTSALPDTATVANTCTLEIKTSSEVPGDADNRSLTVGWRDGDTPWSSSDYILAAGTDANSGTDITSIAANTVLDITLTGCTAHVDLTGRTCVQLWVSGGAPSGTNLVDFKASVPSPQLQITYQP